MLSHFKALCKIVGDTEDEFMIAFNDLNKTIEKQLKEMLYKQQTNKYDNEEEVQIVEKQEQQDYYGTYYSNLSTLESCGTYGGKFSLKSESALKISSMSQSILEKLRYIVFNDSTLLELTFDDNETFQKYYDSFFEKMF